MLSLLGQIVEKTKVSDQTKYFIIQHFIYRFYIIIILVLLQKYRKFIMILRQMNRHILSVCKQLQLSCTN